MPLPRTTKTRNQLAEARRRLANVKVFVPGRGIVSIAQMFEPISASDTDPRIRAELTRTLEHLAALLSPLPPAARDEAIERIAEFITDAASEAREQTNKPDSEAT